MRKLARTLALVIAGAGLLWSCESLDDDRIPRMPVSITFQSAGMWETFGVPGATDYRVFIREKMVPVGFPYTAMSYTGFGGVLLVGDYLGNPQAFDLACPVEAQYDVRIAIDPEENIARCPECRSTYDVFANYGIPLSGPAVTRKCALTHYHVNYGSGPLEYMVVTR